MCHEFLLTMLTTTKNVCETKAVQVSYVVIMNVMAGCMSGLCLMCLEMSFVK